MQRSNLCTEQASAENRRLSPIMEEVVCFCFKAKTEIIQLVERSVGTYKVYSSRSPTSLNDNYRKESIEERNQNVLFDEITKVRTSFGRDGTKPTIASKNVLADSKEGYRRDVRGSSLTIKQRSQGKRRIIFTKDKIEVITAMLFLFSDIRICKSVSVGKRDRKPVIKQDDSPHRHIPWRQGECTMTGVINFPSSVLISAAKAAAVHVRYTERELGVSRKVRGLTPVEHRQVLEARRLASRLARAS